MDAVKTITITFKVAAGVLVGYLGGLPMALKVLLGMIVLDIITGFLAAFICKTLSSDASMRGMAKKVLMLSLVGAGHLIEKSAEVNIPICEFVAGFYAAHEGLSTLENVSRAGLPVPKILTESLSKLNPTAPAEQQPSK